VKKLLGILLLAFITTVGFSGAVAANDWNDNNGIWWGGHGGNILWSGDWNDWRGSWFWRHHFRGDNFWWRGHHFRKEFRHDRFGRTIIVIVGTPGVLPL
jgi:hypothetical protein